MEAICSSKKLADFQRTSRRYIQEDGTFHNHRCENLKSYKLLDVELWKRTFINTLDSEAHHIFGREKVGHGKEVIQHHCTVRLQVFP
jgi:hypothetical protein